MYYDPCAVGERIQLLRKERELTQAAGYYHIGENKLRTLIDKHPNDDFYVMNGNRALIKREKFERYLDQATVL